MGLPPSGTGKSPSRALTHRWSFDERIRVERELPAIEPEGAIRGMEDIPHAQP